MTKKELVNLMIVNFTDGEGNLDLSNLDFAEINFSGTVDFSNIITGNTLYIKQCHVLYGDLYQDTQIVDNGNISQGYQKASCIFQRRNEPRDKVLEGGHIKTTPLSEIITKN